MEQSHAGPGRLPPISTLLVRNREKDTRPPDRESRKTGFNFEQSLLVGSGGYGSFSLPSLSSLASGFYTSTEDPLIAEQSLHVSSMLGNDSSQRGALGSETVDRQRLMETLQPDLTESEATGKDLKKDVSGLVAPSLAQLADSFVKSPDDPFSTGSIALPSLSSFAGDLDVPFGDLHVTGQPSTGVSLEQNQSDRKDVSIFEAAGSCSVGGISQSLSAEKSSESGVGGLGPLSLFDLADSFETSADNPFGNANRSLPSLSSLASSLDATVGSPLGSRSLKSSRTDEREGSNVLAGCTGKHVESSLASSQHGDIGIEPSLSQLAVSFEKSPDNPVSLAQLAGAECLIGDCVGLEPSFPFVAESCSSGMLLDATQDIADTDIVDGTGGVEFGLAAVSLASLAATFEQSPDNPLNRADSMDSYGLAGPADISSRTLEGMEVTSQATEIGGLPSDARQESSAASFGLPLTGFVEGVPMRLHGSSTVSETGGLSLAGLAEIFETSSDYPSGSQDAVPSLAELYRMLPEESDAQNVTMEPSGIATSSSLSASEVRQMDNQRMPDLPSAGTGHGDVSLADLAKDFCSSSDYSLPGNAGRSVGRDLAAENRGIKRVDRAVGECVVSGDIVTGFYAVESSDNVEGTSYGGGMSPVGAVGLSTGTSRHKESEPKCQTRAHPTLFARVLCTSLHGRGDVHTRIPSVSISFVSRIAASDIEPFDFSSPSPDDIVVSKQQLALKRTGNKGSRRK